MHRAVSKEPNKTMAFLYRIITRKFSTFIYFLFNFSVHEEKKNTQLKDKLEKDHGVYRIMLQFSFLLLLMSNNFTVLINFIQNTNAKFHYLPDSLQFFAHS